jgi:phosphoglycolate phosphatase
MADVTGCVVFDLDGTLIDSREDLAAGVNIMRQNWGLPPLTVETVTSYIGNGAKKLVERALSDAPGADRAAALGIMRDAYSRNMLVKTRLYPGVEEGLRRLHTLGVKMAVVSNKPETPSKLILKYFGVDCLFERIAGGDSGFPLKPDPAALLDFVKFCGARPEDSWIAGDNYTDLEAGRRASMKRCLFLYGFGDPKDEPRDFEAPDFASFVGRITGN